MKEIEIMRNAMDKVVIGGLLLVWLWGAGVGAQDEQKKQEPSYWMKQKLAYSQQILNGLAQEDYELIAKSATAMKGLNTIESFVRQRPEGYRTQLKTFQFSVDELIRHAEDDNLDGATLAFTQMTISCVNCHKELRKQ
jgi:cytochrome c556